MSACASALWHFADLLTICVVSDFSSRAGHRKIAAQVEFLNFSWIFFPRRFPLVATFLSVVTLGKENIFHEWFTRAVETECSLLMMIVDFASNAFSTGHSWAQLLCSCSVGGGDKDSTVFGFPFTLALQSYLWLWYFHPIPFQDCGWGVSRVACCQMQLTGMDVSKVFLYQSLSRSWAVKHYSPRCLQIGEQLSKALKRNNLNFKKSFYNCVITDVN